MVNNFIMNRDNINKILCNIEEDIKYVETISNDIVTKKTKDLDSLMRAIQAEIVDIEEPSDKVIEKYFLELTNALYFINAYCEGLGFYDDISKSNAKLAYNKAYSENQIANTLKNVKVTVNDNVLFAENASLDETIVNLIYNRSFKIIKVKIDQANEMVKTLSKVLSSRMSDKQLTGISSNKYLNTNEIKGDTF